MINIKKATCGLVLAGLPIGVIHGEDELPPLTVLAKRFDESVDETSSSVDVITAKELERRQEYRLIDALELTPGVQGLSTAGQTGNLGSILFRGLGTKYVQVVVDGVRITDATNGASNFLGAGHLGNISQLEILRGPQSVLYGSGASAGVVGYGTALGTGESETESMIEVGDFGHLRTSLSSTGQSGDLTYAAGLGYFETANDPFPGLPVHDYQQAYETLALEWQANDGLVLRMSYRGSQNELMTVTDFGGGFFSPATIKTDVNLLALNGELKVNPWWTSKLTLGYYDEAYDADFGGFPVRTDYRRATAHWSNRIELSDDAELTGGIEYSDSDYENLNGRNINYETLGAYVSGTWRPVEPLLLEGGVRYEDHSSFGDDVAWNLGFAYEIEESQTRLRARLSESFRTPTLVESEAFTPPFGLAQAANPNLISEDIVGYEIGLEQDVLGQQAGITYFHQDLENAIGLRNVPGGKFQNYNIPGRSTVSGLEIALSGELPVDGFSYRVAWTEQDSEEVLDVPDRIVSVDVSYEAERWSAGAGATYTDGATYGFFPTDDRIVTRVYGEIEVSESFTLFGRIENLFDEEYLLSDDGFLPVEGQGRAIYVGASLKW
ncbi:MAG: TonB-dependent receptor plug domain-containing protein [Verrucomicrobiaceae bacterium]